MDGWVKFNTLIFAVHHPHASFSFDLANTSTSWFSTNSVCLPVSFGGRNTCEKGNFDSGCQLQSHTNIYYHKSTKTLQILNTNNQNLHLLIFKGYENLVVEHVGDNGLKIQENFSTFLSSRNLVLR